MKWLFAVVLLALAGCASTPQLIVGTGTDAAGKPVEQTGIKITNQTVIDDLRGAASNFDNAVQIGALSANDPAPACIHDVLIKAGIDVPAGGTAAKSFVPVNAGAVSAGSILYIQAQQLKASLGLGFTVAPACEALVGRVVIDGLRAVNKIGAGLVLKGL